MQRQSVISTRVPTRLAEEIRTIVGEDYFLNEADFFRTALRNEIFKYRLVKIRAEYSKNKKSVKAVKKLRKLTSRLAEKEYEKWVHEAAKDMP